MELIFFSTRTRFPRIKSPAPFFGTNIDSFKFIYSKVTKHLDVHRDELGDNFNASSAECKIVFKQWFGNKFNVNITMVNYWETN